MFNTHFLSDILLLTLFCGDPSILPCKILYGVGIRKTIVHQARLNTYAIEYRIYFCTFIFVFQTNHEMGGGGASSIPTEFEPSVPTTSTVDNVEEATKQVKKPKNIVTSWGGSLAGSGPSAPSGKGSTTSLASRQGASAEDPNNADTPTRRALRQAVKVQV